MWVKLKTTISPHTDFTFSEDPLDRVHIVHYLKLSFYFVLNYFYSENDGLYEVLIS